MTDQFKEYKEKLAGVQERMEAGIKVGSSGWKALAFTVISDLDQRLDVLADIKYQLRYAVQTDNRELYDVAIDALCDRLGKPDDG